MTYQYMQRVLWFLANYCGIGTCSDICTCVHTTKFEFRLFQKIN